MSAVLAKSKPEREATAQARRGLDGLNLFVANIQTGFGPFIAVYLTTQGWTQTAIGTALSLGTIAAMASQIPAGALVDAIRNKAVVAFFSILAFSASALLLAIRPTPLWVYAAEALHGFSSCTLGPAIAAMSLILVGPAMLGLRLGRNARFASIGNGVGAALMGACGYYVSEQAVFFLTAAVTLPAVVSLLPLARLREPVSAAAASRPGGHPPRAAVSALLTNRTLMIFALCAMLFTLGNSAMLPLAGNTLTKEAGNFASLLIAGCIIVPQLVVAAISPAIGQLAQRRGRRLVLLIGFCTLPVRGLLFATLDNPAALVLIQGLDGIAAACVGILVPLIASDIAGRSGRYNLSLGIIGLAIGVGATISTALAGWAADVFGTPAAYASLALVGLAALLLAAGAMPETRPPSPESEP
ncbi:MAG TPA: MFS transporter [Stellaceae bacterium]|jgi:MFS family permease|nr:MFS transporter [Stellaceae bacterium]